MVCRRPTEAMDLKWRLSLTVCQQVPVKEMSPRSCPPSTSVLVTPPDEGTHNRSEQNVGHHRVTPVLQPQIGLSHVLVYQKGHIMIRVWTSSLATFEIRKQCPDCSCALTIKQCVGGNKNDLQHRTSNYNQPRSSGI